MIKIAPSVLSADFSNLERQIRLVEKGGADWLHLDVMDGHFVPNLTFGPLIVKAIRSITNLPLDVHLMIEHPDQYLEDFKKAGSDRLTVHVETCSHLHRTVQRIKELGMKAGVTLNPATPALTVKEIIPYVDLVLVMTVNPGFGGQKFIFSMLKKIEAISALIANADSHVELEVDGGVDESNAFKLVQAGATVIVAGNSIFSKKNIPQAIRNLRKAAQHIPSL
ncbi:MAG: ribulose-phosphate 3-epimerase [Ignavibacteria bacterium]|nr:ribulose-phosphate 3-epimerase [Ignavibacteria bacterium]MBI3765749.1 ribulose-phosphate 3-epimerase [Ignavibacteriales bacterium]